MNPHPRRILIVDDHPMVRVGLRKMLEGSGRYVVSGEAGSPSQAIRELSRGVTDCAIVDLVIKGRTRIDMVAAIREAAPELPVVVLSMLDRREVGHEVAKAGATVYVGKEEAPSRVIEELDRIFPPATSPANSHDDVSLTPRERSIFDLLGAGLDKHDITRVLGISVKTVETHREALKRKLGVPSIRDLVRTAVQIRQRN